MNRRSGPELLLISRVPVYINLPVCGLAFVILWVSLRRVYARRVSDLSWGDFGRTFDFLGL